MTSVQKLMRYSVGVGGGVFIIGLVAWRPIGEALGLAAVVVAAGWVLWGGLALAPEFKSVFGLASSAARVVAERRAAPAAGLVLDAQLADDDDQADDQAEPPARWVVVHEKSGPRVLALKGRADDFERRVIAFLILGERLGSFKYRNMKGRALSTGERLNYPSWRAFTDALAGRGMFLKDKAEGARPVGGVRSVINRVSAGGL